MTFCRRLYQCDSSLRPPRFPPPPLPPAPPPPPVDLPDALCELAGLDSDNKKLSGTQTATNINTST